MRDSFFQEEPSPPDAVSLLARWCRAHASLWRAEPAGHGPLPLIFAPAGWGGGQRARLVREGGRFRLETESGELLATASDLPAVLDALTAGVAEAVFPERREKPGNPALAALVL